MNVLAMRLPAMVDGCLRWLDAHLELFDPFAGGDAPDLYHSKAVLELASTCLLHHRAAPQNPRVRRFLSFIGGIWEKPTFHERLARNPERFRLYATTYVALLQCGMADDSYREVVQNIVDTGYATATEEVPFRGLDMRHMLDSGGFAHDLPPYRELYANTLLAKMPPVPYLTEYDVYSITHTLFYLADFGFRPIDAIPGTQLPEVRRTTATLLGIFLRARNWDLVGELLLACRCLQWMPPFAFTAAWQALLDAQRPDGSVPGPHPSAPGEDPVRKRFEDDYHTTIVAALAGFLSAEWLASGDGGIL